MRKRVYTGGRLRRAGEQFRKRAAAAGIDHMTVQQFEPRRQELLELITEKRTQGHLRFKPVRRTRMEKEGSSKQRKSGIPTVMDRVVGQAMHRVPAEILDRSFSRSNFGFRLGKSQPTALRHVPKAVWEGYTWWASIDLKNFFDEIPHGVILKRLRGRIQDEGFIP